MQFKGHTAVQALLDSGSGVNVTISAYAAVVGLHICPINVGAQKIDRSTLLISYMMLGNFQLDDKKERTCFF